MNVDTSVIAPIVLEEYRDEVVDLLPIDAIFIRQSLRQRIDITRSIEGSSFVLNSRQSVGVVLLPSGRRLECRPKVPISNFFTMLAIAYDLDPGFLDQQTTFGRIDDLFEFVVAYFAELVERQVTRGLYRSYVEREENLPTVRGRILIGEDLRRNHLLRQRTFCQFTEFTWDIPENQIVRQVAHLVGQRVKNRLLRADLHRIDRRLDEIAPVVLPASAIDRFTYHRLNDDYRPIHQLCRLFLDGSSVAEDAGEFDFRTFLFNMNDLFETFVTRLFQQWAPSNVTIEVHDSLSLGTHGEIRMKPDLLVRRDRNPVLVMDCKYKRLQHNEVKHHDLYQLLAYCTVTDVRRGVLIYPQHEQIIDSHVQVRNTAITLHQMSLDLAVARSEFRQTCHDFVARVLTRIDT